MKVSAMLGPLPFDFIHAPPTRRWYVLLSPCRLGVAAEEAMIGPLKANLFADDNSRGCSAFQSSQAHMHNHVSKKRQGKYINCSVESQEQRREGWDRLLQRIERQSTIRERERDVFALQVAWCHWRNNAGNDVIVPGRRFIGREVVSVSSDGLMKNHLLLHIVIAVLSLGVALQILGVSMSFWGASGTTNLVELIVPIWNTNMMIRASSISWKEFRGLWWL